jgi:hypothetical protein
MEADRVPAAELRQRFEQGARLEPGRRQRTKGASQLAHGRRGAEAAPHDVADRDPESLPRLEPERVVPVASDLEPLDRGAVGDPDLDALALLKGAREEAALQLERHLLFAPSRLQQLLLIATAVGRIEDGRADHTRPACVVVAQNRVDERRQVAAVRADDLDRDLAHRSLHPQQRRVMRLVVDLPTRGQ